MDYRTLEITLQYAKDLNKVNFISKMDVYVVVSISGGDRNSKQKTKTSVDHDGDADPMWRFPMKFMVEEAALRQNRLMLDFKLKCDRALGDKDIGEVHVPIKDLVDSTTKSDAGAKKFVSYQVTKPSGKPKGQLTFSYRFREKATNTAATPPPPPVEVVHGASPCRPAAARANYPPPARESPPKAFGGGYPQDIEQTPAKWGPPQPWCGYPPPEPRRMPPGGDVYPPQPWCGYPQEPPPPPTPSGGVYPPQHSHGYLPSPQSWCGYPPEPRLTPPGDVYPPQRCDGFRPPLMQLAPNWWITDWRYEVDPHPV